MKIKFLLLSVLCVFAAALAACTGGTGVTGEDGGGISSYSSSVQTEQTEQSSEAAASTEDNTESNTEDDTDEVTVMYVTINGNKLEVQLEDNTSAAALADLLKQGDITYTASDYGGFEKVGNIGHTLPRNDEQITTQAGDVILYQGNSLCLYYGTNSWSFTRIGRINGYTAAEIKELLCAGEGSVQVTLSLN